LRLSDGWRLVRFCLSGVSWLRAGRRLASAAMTADENHARIDGFVSLGVVVSAIVVALRAQIADPIIGMTITLVIFKITWDSRNAVRKAKIDLERVGDANDHAHSHAA
jgi:Co/Zn/Cd efflux system component